MIMAPPFCSMKKRTAREVFTFLSVRFLESLNIKQYSLQYRHRYTSLL